MGPEFVGEVNRTASLPGRTCGQRWVTSPGLRLVNGAGVPPAEETCDRSAAGESARTIVPLSPQLAPRRSVTSHKVTAAPPSTGIFLSLPPAANPIHWPSGEKNGELAPSVPANW